MQEYDNPQEYYDTLARMQDSTTFQQRFGQHHLYQNNHWQQYAFHNTKHMPEHWPEDLWRECWQNEYIDFTPDSWVNLPWRKQFRYARSYQQWYMQYSCLYNTVHTVKGANLKIQLIPPGKFWMGSPENERGRCSAEMRHRVLIDKPFYIGKYPITQDQWLKVMGNNPYKFEEVGINTPVENVGWDDCVEFCKKAEVELPTEAQWEYACRGGTTSIFNTGDTITPDRVNYGNFTFTTTVGSLPNANSWGCYDFHGNVWERCKDWYGGYAGDDIVNPIGPNRGPGRVIRGGCCRNAAIDVRSACRSFNSGSGGNYTGFRFSLPCIKIGII